MSDKVEEFNLVIAKGEESTSPIDEKIRSNETSVLTASESTLNESNDTVGEEDVDVDDEEEQEEEEDEKDEEDEKVLKKTRLGICAMDKKARSKPMAQILSRLNQDLFEIVNHPGLSPTQTNSKQHPLEEKEHLAPSSSRKTFTRPTHQEELRCVCFINLSKENSGYCHHSKILTEFPYKERFSRKEEFCY